MSCECHLVNCSLHPQIEPICEEDVCICEGVPIINNWSIVISDSVKYAYVAPELRPRKIAGNILRSNRFYDDESIVTSSIVKLQDCFIITKRGSKYLLGTINKDYEVRFNTSFAEVMRSLKSHIAFMDAY